MFCKNPIAVLGFSSLFLLTPHLSSHCNEPLIVTLSHPNKLVAQAIPSRSGSVKKVWLTVPNTHDFIQIVNYTISGSLDTIRYYEDSLRIELLQKFAKFKNVSIGIVDSVRNYVVIETSGADNYQEYLRVEDVWFTLTSQLKGTASKSGEKYSFTNRKLYYLASNPFTTSYTGNIGIPFVAFYDDKPEEIGLNTIDGLGPLNGGFGPLDGCFYEPSGYLILKDRVYKKGKEGARMAGVSIPLSEVKSWATNNPIVNWANTKGSNLHNIEVQELTSSDELDKNSSFYQINGQRKKVSEGSPFSPIFQSHKMIEKRRFQPD